MEKINIVVCLILICFILIILTIEKSKYTRERFTEHNSQVKNNLEVENTNEGENINEGESNNLENTNEVQNSHDINEQQLMAMCSNTEDPLHHPTRFSEKLSTSGLSVSNAFDGKNAERKTKTQLL